GRSDRRHHHPVVALGSPLRRWSGHVVRLPRVLPLRRRASTHHLGATPRPGSEVDAEGTDEVLVAGVVEVVLIRDVDPDERVCVAEARTHRELLVVGDLVVKEAGPNRERLTEQYLRSDAP